MKLTESTALDLKNSIDILSKELKEFKSMFPLGIIDENKAGILFDLKEELKKYNS